MKSYIVYYFLLTITMMIDASILKDTGPILPLFEERSFPSYDQICPNEVQIDINLASNSKKTLIGLECMTHNHSLPFHVFQGIPFAEPPLASRRFKDPIPKPLSALPEKYNATYTRNSCIQTFLNSPNSNGNNKTKGNEDCLYLNIYKPKISSKDESETLIPVVFYIHGGAFIVGSGNIPIPNAEEFIEKEVILVVVNYRLGVFGFLCTEDEASPGNYGLKDQIVALQWVQDNIAKFGGDPDRVTIFGQSAGAASVLYLIQTPRAKGLFHAAIADSGSSLCSWAFAPNPLGIAKSVGLLLGIPGTANTTTLVEELRKIDNVTLSKRSSFTNILSSFNGLPWAPCRDNDVVSGTSYRTLEKGELINKVPLLIGFNSNEARDFSVTSKRALAFLKTKYSVAPNFFVPTDMNSSEKREDSTGIKIKEEYTVRILADNLAFINYSTEDLFTKPINRTVQIMSKYVPVYFYEFSYTGGDDFQNYTSKAGGAAHSEELQFLMNHPQNKNTNRYNTSMFVTDFMSNLWTNFAKFGNPTPELVYGISWKAANVTGNQNLTYLNIDVVPKIGNAPRVEKMIFWNSLYEQNQNGTGTTF